MSRITLTRYIKNRKENILYRMKQHVLKVHPNDNVIVALTNLAKNENINFNGEAFQLQDNIAAKHKFAAKDFEPGDEIVMYGVLVGKAQSPIARGAWISTRNVKHAASAFTVGERKTDWIKPDVSKFVSRTFNGHHRSDGSVGTANLWIVIPMVFCENRNMEILEQALVTDLGYGKNESYKKQSQQLVELYKAGKSVEEIISADIEVDATKTAQQRLFKNVDGIKFLTHELGCGGTRQDAKALCGLLAGYITHPNVAGATVLSLGCQNAQVAMLEEEIVKRSPNFNKPLYILEQQKIGEINVLISQAIKKTFAGLMMANENERKPAPLSKLCIGLECGGSDGLITDAIKSAGAAKKGGTSPVTDVLDYPEKVRKPGLNLLCTPGNDVESTTAEVAAGANIVLFTTGLGTPTGNPVAPVVKISSNTALYRRMPDIIDINTGTIIEGEETIQQAGERILEYVIGVASGETEAAAVRHGQNDFIPWKRGVSL